MNDTGYEYRSGVFEVHEQITFYKGSKSLSYFEPLCLPGLAKASLRIVNMRIALLSTQMGRGIRSGC